MWERMTANEIATMGGTWRKATLDLPYADIVARLGEPHKNGDADFPDDATAVDVCWGMKRDDGARVVIWNYKNGPAYCGPDYAVEKIRHFSVYYKLMDLPQDFAVMQWPKEEQANAS